MSVKNYVHLFRRNVKSNGNCSMGHVITDKTNTMVPNSNFIIERKKNQLCTRPIYHIYDRSTVSDVRVTSCSAIIGKNKGMRESLSLSFFIGKYNW